jgi:hypothetical protein
LEKLRKLTDISGVIAQLVDIDDAILVMAVENEWIHFRISHYVLGLNDVV